MIRWLSRSVTIDGKPLGLSIVEVHDGGEISVRPFVKEEEAVRYTDKAIEIKHVNDRPVMTFVEL